MSLANNILQFFKEQYGRPDPTPKVPALDPPHGAVLDVELSETGKVVAVWYGCKTYDFKTWKRSDFMDHRVDIGYD